MTYGPVQVPVNVNTEVVRDGDSASWYLMHWLTDK